LWTKVPAVSGTNVIFNSLSKNIKTLFSVNSKGADQIGLVFGDGIFADIPTGNFRCYFRTGNGFTYKISPADMNDVQITIPYVSHSGQVETLTANISLKQTVSNASARENLNDVKTKAQQQYYTQARMVTGEDYQIYPFTSFNNIVKAKAVNRTSSGISRYLDVRDTTGKYSSTNIVAEDGIFYRDELIKTFSFTFITSSDISNVLAKNVEPTMQNKESLHFYYKNYPFVDISVLGITWNNTTKGTGISTGYFKNAALNPQSIATFTSSNMKYAKELCLLKFIAPAGYVFDVNNNLVVGTSGMLNSKDYVWAGINKIVDDGTNRGVGNLDDGTGPVTLSEVIPDGAMLTKIIAPWDTNMTSTMRTSVISNITNYKTFGLRYDYDTQAWTIITALNLDQAETFALTYAGNTDSLNRDNSWFFLFTNDGSTYTVKYRSTAYIFESLLETRFYFDKTLKIFDPRLGKTIKDKINMLKINSLPDSSTALGHDYIMHVDDRVIESDGYTLSEKIKVTFPDTDADGIVDNPEVFDVVVSPAVNAASKIVFYKSYLDNSGYTRYLPIASTDVETLYTNLIDISAAKAAYSNGQIFYASETEKFYILSIDSSNQKVITETTDYLTKIGRDSLIFQYTHNSPNNRRIDPSPSNIIDLFLLVSTYDTDYRNWVTDITNTVSKPAKPTTTELRDSFGSLEQVKSVSDTLIFNSVSYRPLFGDKADEELQATFKIVKNQSTLVSDNEVKEKVITTINNYFSLGNWDFGDTFYFSELSAFLHAALSPDVLSIIIVPRSATSSFGSLFQIQSLRDEIFISAATVNDVEIIDVITAAQLRASGDVVNLTSDQLITESATAGSAASTVTTTSNTTASTTTAIKTTSSGGYSY